MRFSYPLFSIALCLLSGFIVSGTFGNNDLTIPFSIGVLYGIINIILWLCLLRTQWLTAGIICLVFFLLYGLTSTQRIKNEESVNHFKNDSYQKLAFECIKPIKENDPRNWLIKVIAIQNKNNEWVSRSGKLILYLDSDINLDLYGAQFISNDKAMALKFNRNPSAFCYSTYLKREFGVSHKIFSTQQDLIFVDFKKFSFPKWLAKSRSHLLKTLQICFKKESTKAIMSAMLLGQKQDLNSAQKTDFRNAGVFHLLAVSGLHVGILCAILIFCVFGLFPSSGSISFLGNLIILLCLWFYVLLTGSPPSAIRAGVMCSIYLIGRNLGFKIYALNIVATVFIMMLFINPQNIYRIGFQFSFLALTGIILISPILLKWNETQNKLYQYTWTIMAISLGAQLGVAPLSIYYFNTFPNYFLLSNVLTTPFTGVIICLGLIIILLGQLHFLHPLCILISNFTELLLDTFSKIVWGISSIPFAVTDHLYIELWQLVLMYVIICIIWSALKWRHPFLLLTFHILICCYVFSSFTANNKIRRSLTLTVYEKHNRSCTDLISFSRIINMQEDYPIEDQTYLASSWRNRLTSGKYDIESYDLNVFDLEFSAIGINYILYPDINSYTERSLTNSIIVVNRTILQDILDSGFPTEPMLIVLDSTVLLDSTLTLQLKSCNLNIYSVAQDGPFIKQHSLL